MKKSFKVLCLMLIVFMMTGCMKFNMVTSINKDKSMDFSIIQAFNNAILESSDQDTLSDADLNEANLEEFKQAGFTVENYSDGSWTGYQMKKNIPNIDDISSNDPVSGNLENILSGQEKDFKLFTVKKGFLQNTYTASFELNTDEAINDAANYLDDSTGNTTDNFNGNTYDNSADYSMFMAGMDLKFVINLPYEAINSNATSLTNDGKTLTWDLVNFKENNIEFEFELYNMTNIYLSVGIVALIIIIIIVLIVKHHKKAKSNKSTLNTQNNEPTLNNETVVTPMTPITETVNPTSTQPDTNSNLNKNISVTTPVQETASVPSTPESATPVQEAAPVPSTPEPEILTEPVQEVKPTENIVQAETTVTQVEPVSSSQASTPKPLQENENTVENINYNLKQVVTETKTPDNTTNQVTTDIFNSLPNSENK